MGPDCSRCSVNMISYYYYYHYYCQASRISPPPSVNICHKRCCEEQTIIGPEMGHKSDFNTLRANLVLESHHILMRIALSFCPSDCSHASLRAQAWPLLHQVP